MRIIPSWKKLTSCAIIWGLTLVGNACTYSWGQNSALDTSALPVKIEKAFTKFESPIERPIIVDFPPDGTNRLIIASQLGTVYVLPNDQEVKTPKVFLDISKQVVFNPKQNEEGLLGLAFHPKYRENGKFYIYYTTTEKPQLSVISEFRVSKEDPNKADPASERELMRIPQPFWNHNGGTLVFGPDGHLYIALGDGGAANDPMMNGQNVATLLGSILRIDVDRTDNNLEYGIPTDNPFVGHGPKARGEIWAYGFRNPWRIAFDRETGTLWAADVGQDLWEEIDVVRRGGNYGWNLREGLHKFGPVGSEARPDLIDPVFEYHHDIGKSITGGTVYRGKQVPALVGKYIYADYVAGKVWALAFDPKTYKATGNHLLGQGSMPIITFGEDEAGEMYFTTDSHTIHRFAPAK